MYQFFQKQFTLTKKGDGRVRQVAPFDIVSLEERPEHQRHGKLRVERSCGW
ncbi:hypothetical protein CKA32_001804 [Geitlerinema sp. FC II]|nr:hypothetical protein CKA32_001804 [Geitlerinema sp. FC II]